MYGITLFLAVNALLRWLNNVSCVYSVQVSLILFGQQGLGHFFRYRHWLPIGWRTMQIVRRRRRKMTKYRATPANHPFSFAPTTLSAIKAASRSTISWDSPFKGGKCGLSDDDEGFARCQGDSGWKGGGRSAKIVIIHLRKKNKPFYEPQPHLVRNR